MKQFLTSSPSPHPLQRLSGFWPPFPSENVKFFSLMFLFPLLIMFTGAFFCFGVDFARDLLILSVLSRTNFLLYPSCLSYFLCYWFLSEFTFRFPLFCLLWFLLFIPSRVTFVFPLFSFPDFLTAYLHRMLISGSFLIQALKAINFPLSLTLDASHTFQYIVFSLPFNSIDFKVCYFYFFLWPISCLEPVFMLPNI